MSNLPAVIQTAKVPGPQAGKLRSTIVQAAQALQDVKWGAAGSITGMTVRIPRSDLWVNYLCAVEYDNDSIQEMADSLRVNGQLRELTVTPMIDPRSDDQGGTGAKYLIVDGARRFYAAGRAGRPDLEDLECVVNEYADSYVATRTAVILKASQRELDDSQAGTLMRRLFKFHEAARKAWGRQVEEWPKQQEWARILGRSQPTIARWMGLARLSGAAGEALDEGILTSAQAAELISAPKQVQAAVTEIVVEAAIEGRTPTRDDVRGAVLRLTGASRERPARPPIDLSNALPDVEQLMLPFIAEEPDPARRVRALAHDLREHLAAALNQMDRRDPDWDAVYKALNRARIGHFIDGEE